MLRVRQGEGIEIQGTFGGFSHDLGYAFGRVEGLLPSLSFFFSFL